jgi:hypothetical protein
MSDQKNLQKLLETGAEIVGATVGGAIGLIAGPAGAIGGGAAGVIVSKSLIEFTHRFLSKREQARVGAAASLTIVGIEERREKGEELRQDGFFDAKGTDRSKAEELFEGVLLKCRDEYEEKKIMYISKLYENVAFDSSISPDNANQILNTAQQLSYRQLTIINLVGQNTNTLLQLRKEDFRGDNYVEDIHNLLHDQQFLLQDFISLANQGIIQRADNRAMIHNSDVAPANMKFTFIGKSYYDFMSLHQMCPTEFHFLDFLKA